MRRHLLVLAGSVLLLAGSVFLGGCSCGFDCNNEDSRGTTTLSLGFSDALPEDLKQVVIEVDSITFRRTGVEDVVVDNFTIPALGLSAVDTFQVDLLQYRGRNQLVVITDLELASGSYSQVQISVLGGDVNRSYVQQSDDTLAELTVSGGVLTLAGPGLARGEQAYTVEFSLAQSLREELPGERYLMTAQGIRLENNATAASLSGRVDSSLFDAVSPCDEKTDPARGNRLYIYQGAPGATSRLGDVFTSGSATTVPSNVVAPFAVASLVLNALTANWEYVFGFLPAGDYTLAFACNTADDDPVNFDDLLVPQPQGQVYPVTLTAGAAAVCDVTASESC
ncbi:MAG: DUF4382 domain-containing protein [Halieaceae bacterium]|jgi:hypothetical protein|nr:DUF4382 domain-containing protein [Halieaceae bacterium]